MSRSLRFLTFNIHGGRSRDGQRDIGRVHALMERFNIDIGVFQEMETRPSRGASPDDVKKLAGATRPYRVYGASIIEESGWFGNLTVSRYPILRSIVHNLETKADLEPRNALDVLINGPRGKLRLINTHLSLSVFERWSEANNLLRLMQAVEEEERHPLFLMGDINEWQYPSRLIRFLGSIMQPLPCRATFPSFLPVLKLDRAWFDAPGLNVTAHRLDNNDIRLLSDHLPVLVEVIYPLGD
jgi:endonuclease/exonuclease/phosphatase family metal-dependent hydrolase